MKNLNLYKKIKKPSFKNQRGTFQIRVTDKDGKNLGIMDFSEALKKAEEENLDLVRVTRKITPPVYKILDKGKYLYQQKKKEKLAKPKKTFDIKETRLRFAISLHDLETKALQAKKFLEQGNKVRIMMKLRGRENALQDFAKEKVDKFLKALNLNYKIERELKRERGGLSMIISKE